MQGPVAFLERKFGWENSQERVARLNNKYDLKAAEIMSLYSCGMLVILGGFAGYVVTNNVVANFQAPFTEGATAADHGIVDALISVEAEVDATAIALMGAAAWEFGSTAVAAHRKIITLNSVTQQTIE